MTYSSNILPHTESLIMKRLFIAVLASFLSFPALADTFFKFNADPWTVSGRSETGRNDVCVIDQNWNQKTYFSLYQDMVDGELYTVITNPAWKMVNPPGSTYTVGVDFPTSKNNSAIFEVLAPDTIRIREIKTEQFMKLFVTEQSMLFKMPGNIPDLMIPLKGSRGAFNALAQCMGEYESNKAHPKKKGTGL